MAKSPTKNYASMSVEQLVKLNQNLGRESDALREQRKRINAAIAAKLPKIEPAQNGAVAYVVPDKPAATKRASRTKGGR